MEAEAPNQFEEAMFQAERDCFDKVCEILGLIVFIFIHTYINKYIHKNF